jgi:hypothetical protein
MPFWHHLQLTRISEAELLIPVVVVLVLTVVLTLVLVLLTTPLVQDPVQNSMVMESVVDESGTVAAMNSAVVAVETGVVGWADLAEDEKASAAGQVVVRKRAQELAVELVLSMWRRALSVGRA